MLDFVSAVHETAYSVALLEWLGDFASHFFDNAGVITADLDRVLTLAFCFE